MKLTNFTFSRVGTWLLKSALPMLVFMILSLGVEAQVQTPGDVLADQQGIDLVNDNEASVRLKAQIGQLEAMNPQTDEERANVTLRSKYAFFIFNDVGEGLGYKYALLNSMEYLENRTQSIFESSGISLDPQEIYQEMVDLLRS